ncbi:MAG: radical SAM protein [candidate division WOR-3 bacterium]
MIFKEFFTSTHKYVYVPYLSRIFRINSEIQVEEELKKLNIPSTFKLTYPEEIQIKELLERKVLRHLILNITENCNLRCKYCIYSGVYWYERKYSNNFAKIEIIKKGLEYFLNNSQNSSKIYISFYGGEPLLRKNVIKEVIEWVKNNFRINQNVFFIIDTNGTLINEKNIEMFIKNKIILQISLDGPKGIHDRYRVDKKGKGTFDKVLQNIKKIRKINKEYYENYVVFQATCAPPYNLLEINNFFEEEFFEKNTVNLNFVYPYDTSFFEKYKTKENLFEFTYNELKRDYILRRVKNKEPSPIQKVLFERRIIDIHKELGRKESALIPLNGTCVPGIRRTYMDIKGNLYCCERIGEKFKLGDINNGLNIKKIVKLIEMYKKLSENCTQCWAAKLCNLCFVSAREGKKLTLKRKEEECNIVKKRIEEAFSIYAEIMEKNPYAFEFVKDIIWE